MGRSKDPENAIDYRVHDLSTPLPEQQKSFDLVASHLVLNDVPDYIGFIKTLAAVCRDGGRGVFSVNNPYSAVLREKASGYFATGESVVNQYKISISFGNNRFQKRNNATLFWVC